MSRAGDHYEVGDFTYGDEHTALTVDDLMAKLAELPRDAKVVLEGCDCFGMCVNAEKSRYQGYVLLRRAP